MAVPRHRPGKDPDRQGKFERFVPGIDLKNLRSCQPGEYQKEYGEDHTDQSKPEQTFIFFFKTLDKKYHDSGFVRFYLNVHQKLARKCFWLLMVG
jgi:ABC-type long-subunit fatty acid transport system fused permease/ATPase subunit